MLSPDSLRTQTIIPKTVRKRIVVHGCVQGVGFRPFVYRIAHQFKLGGMIWNTPQGASIEIEGNEESIAGFLYFLQHELPPIAQIDRLEQSDIQPAGDSSFHINKSDIKGSITSIMLPELAVCGDCLHDIQNLHNRRYRYPFTNCTNCGPRFSIIRALPYDRCNTSMSEFEMCDECRTEYEDPLDRRFHAQPNACPVCGPHVELWDANGNVITSHDDALLESVVLLRQGYIVAVKGLGGFHFMADARSEEVIQTLRQRKHRNEKPLALMVPDMKWVERLCEVNDMEREVLQSYSAPIVLLKRKQNLTQMICDAVSGHNPYLGVMLPYTPLHHLLLGLFGYPVVMTSGNLSDEPICIDEQEAVNRLNGIADFYLVHNRKILRHVDDSVVRVFRGEKQVIRRARGYAPLPIYWKQDLPDLLAVGGHLKNTIAITTGQTIFLSQHIGDLETKESLHAFEDVQNTLENTYRCKPETVIHDKHPDYGSTKHAASLGIPTLSVQHHHAHVLSCMAEHHLDENVLGIAWDGTGYGTDGTIWGGEFLSVYQTQFTRIASLEPFPLPGGESSIKNIRLVGLGLLYALYGEDAFKMKHIPAVQSFTERELSIYRTMLKKNLNCPITSSIGRLFDAVAAIIGYKQQISYEGQAAIELEWNTLSGNHEHYPFEVKQQLEFEHANEQKPVFTIQLKNTISQIMDNIDSGSSIQQISTRFHNTLVEMILSITKRQDKKYVVLSGGCFQNLYLLNRVIQRLEQEEYSVYWHKKIPANDGGIALGQIAYAAHQDSRKGRRSCV